MNDINNGIIMNGGFIKADNLLQVDKMQQLLSIVK